MTVQVPASLIERSVGVKRRQVEHVARAVSAEQTVYILHPHECSARYDDLHDCPWSLALDEGIDPAEWIWDVPVTVRVRDGLLVPGKQVAS